MISHKVKTDSLERAASRIDLVPEVEKDNEQDRNDKFTKIKKIRIVDLNQAKEELNKWRKLWTSSLPKATLKL